MTTTDDNDAYLSNNSDDGGQYAGNLGITDAIDYKWDSVLPMAEAAKNLYTGISEGEWTDIKAGVLDFAANGVAVWIDPLNWLISAGLTFLIDFVQPLEDLLSLVTGNAERMEPYAEQWEQLGKALVPLAAAVRQAATDELIEWAGRDAAAAKTRLLEFADAIEATGGEAASISGLLILFSKLMAAAQQIIIGILATLIEWMIVEWAIAMAAAAPTMGGSVAAAGAATGVQATVATTRAVRVMDRVVQLLLRIRDLMARVLPAGLMANVGKSVVQFRGSSATLSTAFRITGSVLRDPGGYVGPGVNAETGLTKYLTAGDSSMSDQQIDDALDVTK
ncbi:hypothetical protein ONA91_22585 [Micromonospora sp. DR5-3]|uniref:hypothetical protein n=1 Tax=unclassified Micromonospora TaxID=2617518 RepID=UPI0016525783|nr:MULTISPECIES: hypothetical protein [unclassified Micromonospora]MCW3817244.1 hypothetical protein [Micromonospora sp. DR5-3]